MAHPYRLDAQSQSALTSAAALSMDVLAQHAAAVDTEARFPRQSIDALALAGLLGVALPKEVGGMGLGFRAFAAVTEELASACGSTAMIYVMHVAASQAVASGNGLSARAELLRRMASGRHLTTLAFSERGSRSNFWAPVSQMREHGAEYEVDAHKSWVTSAREAHSYVSSAQRPGASSPLESTVFLVRRDAAGVEVAGEFNGLGLRGNGSAPVTYTNLTVAPADLISAGGHGSETMLQVVLPWFAIGTAAMSNGLSRSAVALATQHLIGTNLEHMGSQLRDLPTLRARLAEMALRTEQARALLGYTLDHLETGSATAPLLVLQSRLAALQAASDVSDLAMKACGGAAFSKHLGLERVFRDARAGWVMAPTVDHLLEFTGRALTGLPLF